MVIQQFSLILNQSFSTILIKILIACFADLNIISLKFIWENKGNTGKKNSERQPALSEN